MKAPRGHNQPAPPPPQEKLYRVVGPHAVHGAEPGEKIKLALTSERETALVEGGHLKPVEASPTPQPRQAKPDDGAKGAK